MAKNDAKALSRGARRRARYREIAAVLWDERVLNLMKGGGLEEHAPGLYARLHHIREPSATGLAQLAAASVDACFLDGDHTVPGLLADISHAKRITKPGGIIAGHDCHIAAWGSEVTRAVRLAFGVGGFELAPWPYPREGWEPGCSSVWYAEQW